jgi:hypothetical protein
MLYKIAEAIHDYEADEILIRPELYVKMALAYQSFLFFDLNEDHCKKFSGAKVTMDFDRRSQQYLRASYSLREQRIILDPKDRINQHDIAENEVLLLKNKKLLARIKI